MIPKESSLEDVPYVDDGNLCTPILTCTRPTTVSGRQDHPVSIDIHGGGFVHAYKELNRNFCTNLAKLGFAGFSVNYRPPETDFLGHWEDVAAAFRWDPDIIDEEYPIDQNNVFLTEIRRAARCAL